MWYFQMDPPPEVIAYREALWQKLKAEREAWVATQERITIVITLPDGNVVEGTAWETTPYQVAQGIRSVSVHKFQLSMFTPDSVLASKN